MKKINITLAAMTCALAASASSPYSRVPAESWRNMDSERNPVSVVRTPKIESLLPTRSADQPETEFTATEASFFNYGDLYGNGTNAYWLFLSTAPLDKGDPTEPCRMARILLFADPDENPENPTLPTGVFSFAETYEAGTFDPEFTQTFDVFNHPEDPDAGLVGYIYYATDGEVVISRDEEGTYSVKMEYTGALLDSDGNQIETAPCKAEYHGDIPFVDINAYTPLKGDTELNIPYLSGRYTEGNYTLSFYSVELDEYGFIIGAGELFNTEIFTEENSPMNTDDLLGTFSPIDALEAGPVPGHFMQGVWYDIFGGFYAAIGTALSVYDQNVNVTNVGLATDGSITVTKVGEEHKFVFDLVTAEGYKLTGSWQGVVADFVSDFSSNSNVESIAEETGIYGGRGHVTAPAGAEVWSISGTLMDASSLEAGTYIVKYGDTVKKVVVR